MLDFSQINSFFNYKYSVKFLIYKNKEVQEYILQNQDSQNFILKIYDKTSLQTYEFHNQTFLEIKILNELQYIENVPKIIETGTIPINNQKYLYIIFHFISGESLLEKLKREKYLSEPIAEALTIELMEIVRKLHSHAPKIIHNNISPEAIFFNYLQNEKIILKNFRFARFLNQPSNSLNIANLNPFYTSPELFEGTFSTTSDVFAIGALLYNLITGQPPWHADLSNIHDFNQIYFIIHKYRKKELYTHTINNKKLVVIIKKALELNPAKRFQSIEEFLNAIYEKNNLLTSKSRKNKGFNAIAGMHHIKSVLYTDVVEALKQKELYKKYGISIPNGILFFGPPGCGKSYIAGKLAEELQYTFMKLTPADIKSKYLNETEEIIKKVFQEAEKNAPTIIFFDELDAIAPKRTETMSPVHSAPVNELLTRLPETSQKGILVIAATNRPDRIDPAIMRTGRFDKLIFVPPPDTETRKELFKFYLKNKPIELTINYNLLAKITENYVASDIRFLTEEAARQALKQKRKISQKILEEVIKNIPPSIPREELKKYDNLRKKMNTKPLHRKIGFKTKNK